MMPSHTRTASHATATYLDVRSQLNGASAVRSSGLPNIAVTLFIRHPSLKFEVNHFETFETTTMCDHRDE
jgi:hypothetical protein